MATATIEYAAKELQAQEKVVQPKWQRIILLTIIGYEAAGCLAGGSLLMAQPDGRYMSMPVDMMHGAFLDFLIPGIILFGINLPGRAGGSRTKKYGRFILFAIQLFQYDLG